MGDGVKAFTGAHTDDICSSKLFLAQQTEIKSWMLALGFTTVSVCGLFKHEKLLPSSLTV